MDHIFLNQMRMMASIGVYPWEKQIKQVLLIDMELTYDCRAAAQSDALADALDYAAVQKTIQTVLATQHYQLLEKCAHELMAACFAAFAGVAEIKIRLNKGAVLPNVAGVGVFFCRKRADFC